MFVFCSVYNKTTKEEEITVAGGEMQAVHKNT